MIKIYFKRFIIVFFLIMNSYALIYFLTKGAYCNHIRINRTQSLPFYVFWRAPLDKIERDMYVSLRHPCSERQLFKQIVGLPGDIIAIEQQHVFVNSRDYGFIYEISPSGLSLSPIAEGAIPEGFVYVYATHPQSFDSRYAEFGLVAISQLKEKLWPIF